MRPTTTLALMRVRDRLVIAERMAVAQRWTDRLFGLLLHKRLDVNAALLLAPCRSVHTLGMRFPIDIVFIDHSQHVTDVRHRVVGGRICIAPRGTCSTIELAAGRADHCALVAGDALTFFPCTQAESS